MFVLNEQPVRFLLPCPFSEDSLTHSDLVTIAMVCGKLRFYRKRNKRRKGQLLGLMYAATGKLRFRHFSTARELFSYGPFHTVAVGKSAALHRQFHCAIWPLASEKKG